MGPPGGGEFQVNTTTTGAQQLPSVATLSDGGYVVVWHSKNQDGSNYGVFGQRYDATGAPAGNEFQVNTYTTSDQIIPAMAMDADGDFVVTWQDSEQDGNSYGVFLKRYSTNGMAK